MHKCVSVIVWVFWFAYLTLSNFFECTISVAFMNDDVITSFSTGTLETRARDVNVKNKSGVGCVQLPERPVLRIETRNVPVSLVVLAKRRNRTSSFGSNTYPVES